MTSSALIALGSGCALVLVLTPVIGSLATRFGVVAHPRPDRWHQDRVVPRLGGLAICAATVLAPVVLGATGYWAWVLIGALGMALVGLIDDLLFLKPATKLMLQLVAACAFVTGTGGGVWVDSRVLDPVITVFWIVGMTNAVNLLDNMDGLCAGVCGIAAAAFWLGPGWHNAGGLIAAAMTGASAGFLFYNFHPARVFMGDVGSYFLGAILSMLPLAVDVPAGSSRLAGVAVPVLLMLIPIFDTTLVAIARKLAGRPGLHIGAADHSSHRLVALGFPEPRAVLILCGLAVLAGSTVVALSRAEFQTALLLTGIVVTELIVLGVRLARVNVYEGEAFALLQNMRYKPLLSGLAQRQRVFEVVLDACLAGFSYYAAYVIRFDVQLPLHRYLLVTSLPVVIACELAGFTAAGVYRGMWRYITVSDLATYAKGLLFGTFASVLALVYLYRFEGYSRGVFIINALVLGLLVVGSRLSFRAIGELAFRYRKGGRRAIVYGAGDGGALLLRELRANPRYDCWVVGFVDDDPGKRSRRISGVPVLGGGDQLDAVIARERPEVIVLSTDLTPDRLRSVTERCASGGIALLRAEVQLRTLRSDEEPSLAGVVR